MMRQELRLHCSNSINERLWRMSPCHSAAQVAVGQSAADLAHRLASRAALPAEAEHTAQKTEQSAQRSGGYLSGARESVLLWSRCDLTGS